MFTPRVCTANGGPHLKAHRQNYEHIVYDGVHPKCDKKTELRHCFVFTGSLIIIEEDFSPRMWQQRVFPWSME